MVIQNLVLVNFSLFVCSYLLLGVYEGLKEEGSRQLGSHFCDFGLLTEQRLWDVATHLPHEAESRTNTVLDIM